MELIHLVVVLIVIGVLLALLNTWGAAWIDGKILQIINAVIVIAVVLWLLSLFIGFGSLSTIRIGK